MEQFILYDKDSKQIICQGSWDLNNIPTLKKQFKKISLPDTKKIIINGQAITKFDSAGAWFLTQIIHYFQEKNIQVDLQHFSEPHQKLLSLIDQQNVSLDDIPEVRHDGWLTKVGKATVHQVEEIYEFLCFVGRLSIEGLQVFRHPAQLRWSGIASTIEKTGYQALPIIALLSFMIGIVISYQMGNQLRSYGANVFIVNLLGLSILREFGPLLTAIMVAGRTGSAFAAQLGIMKINQEIDALNTMSVTPVKLLLLPRITGLVIVIPLLTMWSNIFGVFGGMVMANNMLDVSWYEFLQRFQQEIPLRTLFIGLGKAPVFALIIGSIGCFQGMKVQGSAESVGFRTTRSVVMAIFYIIIVDAIFSVIFSKYKL